MDSYQEFIQAQRTLFADGLRDLYTLRNPGFLALAEREQEMAELAGEDIDYGVAAERAAAKYPEQFRLYRSRVSQRGI